MKFILCVKLKYKQDNNQLIQLFYMLWSIKQLQIWRKKEENNKTSKIQCLSFAKRIYLNDR